MQTCALKIGLPALKFQGQICSKKDSHKVRLHSSCQLFMPKYLTALL